MQFQCDYSTRSRGLALAALTFVLPIALAFAFPDHLQWVVPLALALPFFTMTLLEGWVESATAGAARRRPSPARGGARTPRKPLAQHVLCRAADPLEQRTV